MGKWTNYSLWQVTAKRAQILDHSGSLGKLLIENYYQIEELKYPHKIVESDLIIVVCFAVSDSVCVEYVLGVNRSLVGKAN